MPQPLDILFEDNHLLVINKPPLLATMGAEKGQATLLSEAKEYIGKKYNKPGNVYLGVVSRLDSFATGTIVFARTSKAAGRLSALRLGVEEELNTPPPTSKAKLSEKVQLAMFGLEGLMEEIAPPFRALLFEKTHSVMIGEALSSERPPPRPFAAVETALPPMMVKP